MAEFSISPASKTATMAADVLANQISIDSFRNFSGSVLRLDDRRFMLRDHIQWLQAASNQQLA